MCGIAGFWGFGQFQNDKQREISSQMSTALQHRGPDSDGTWIDDEAQLSLIHRRLSILDLSIAGNQPMASAKGKVLIFNGEIYNHLELRKEISSKIGPVDWHGHSDTETLLQALETWGIEKTLKKISGMFAFALWDRRNEKLTLVRDKLGEKPLYFGYQGVGNNAVLLFASELKAITKHPSFEGRLNFEAVASLMRYNRRRTTLHLRRHSQTVAGNMLTFERGDIKQSKLPAQMSYWSFERFSEKS